jgi:hypothetical protein
MVMFGAEEIRAASAINDLEREMRSRYQHYTVLQLSKQHDLTK